jgi:hypothetical protein
MCRNIKNGMCEVGDFSDMVFGDMPPDVQGRTVLKVEMIMFIPARPYGIITQITYLLHGTESFLRS